MTKTTRLLGQLIVIVPTVAMSAWLGHQGVPPLQRLIGSLGLGMFLIMVVAYARRRGLL
jgi:hypothetical protein